MLRCLVVVGLFNGSARSLQSRRKAAVTLLHGATVVPALPLPHPLPVSVAVPVTAAQHRRRRRLSFACDHNISLP